MKKEVKCQQKMSNQMLQKKNTVELPLLRVNPDLAADCFLMELRLYSSGCDDITILYTLLSRGAIP